jgi:murein DD-endopeptidase MepM/ murein hydrolase activator NlpD
VTRRALVALAALILLGSTHQDARAAGPLEVSWSPAAPQVGDVGVVRVRGVADGASVQGSVGGHPLAFFRGARGDQVALIGFDLELPAGSRPWTVDVREPASRGRRAHGTIRLAARAFPVQRLTLPPAMVELDPETERRALGERGMLRTLYRTISPERLWRGPFARPIAGIDTGTGFGSRRILNNQPRAPHTGTDYAAPRGTPVVAVNDGRVVLVGEDHGLGLHTAYFHLDEIHVERHDRVVRGQPLGTVGSTGRATGPHLHFGAQLGTARVDPERLLGLTSVE